MSDLAIALGFLLAIFGPLLIIPIVWLVSRIVAWLLVRFALLPNISQATVRWTALGVALVLVAGVFAVSYFPGRWEFDRLCAAHGTPRVSERVTTPSFYRSRLYPYEAAGFLGENAFTFVEAPHMYKKDTYVRYAKREDGKIDQEEVQTLSSQYGVQDNFSELSYGITMREKVVYRMDTNKELARAANITYMGGQLSLLLGAYAMSSCPDILSEQGSQHFQTFYDLETIVLRATYGDPLGDLSLSARDQAIARTLFFSTVYDLLSQVVFQIKPSVHAAYQDQRVHSRSYQA